MGAGDEERLRRLLQGDSDDENDEETLANSWNNAPDAPPITGSFAPGLRRHIKNEKVNQYDGGYSHARVAPAAIPHTGWNTAVQDPQTGSWNVTNSEETAETISDEMATPLAATFGTSKLKSDGLGYYNPDLEKRGGLREVMEQMKPNFYGDTPKHRSIINHISETEKVEVALKKPDNRLRYLNDNGESSRPELGEVSKRLKTQHGINVRERERQILHASGEVLFWKDFTASEIKQMLLERRKPMVFMNNDPGFVAAEDLIDLRQDPLLQVPDIYTAPLPDYSAYERSAARYAKSSTRSVRSVTPRSVDLLHFNEFNSNVFDSDSEAVRTPEQIREFLNDLVDGTPSLRSRSTIKPRAGRTPSDGYSTDDQAGYSTDEFDLSIFDDTPELAPLAPLAGLEIVVRVPDVERDSQIEDLRLHSLKYGRALTITLSKAVTFSPAAYTKRLWAGQIADLQYHPRDHVCIVVFLTPSSAEDLLRHVKKLIRKIHEMEHGSGHSIDSLEPTSRGWNTFSELLAHMQRAEKAFARDTTKLHEYRDLATEVRSLQFEDVSFYRGDQLQAIVPQPKGIVEAVVHEKASRMLRLHRVPLVTRKEDFARKLGEELRLLIVSLCLCAPEQTYKKAAYGCQAIVEFSSITDAWQARAYLKDLYAPDFMEDLCDKPTTAVHSYCDCSSCDK